MGQKIVATSDIHLHTGQHIPIVLVKMGLKDARKVVDGDLLDILPYGIDQWLTPEGEYTIASIVEALGDFDYVIGNHEGRLAWVKTLFKDYPQVRVCKTLDLYSAQTTIHFEHGHRFALDWKILQHIADDITELAVSNSVTRKWWYSFCRKQGWIPSALNKQRGVYWHKQSPYQVAIGTIWSNALYLAQSWNMTVVIGHTHCPLDAKLVGKARLVDCGTRRIVELEL